MEIYDKESRIYNGERIVSSINGVGGKNVTFKKVKNNILYHTQKLTENGIKTSILLKI